MDPTEEIPDPAEDMPAPDPVPSPAEDMPAPAPRQSFACLNNGKPC